MVSASFPQAFEDKSRLFSADGKMQDMDSPPGSGQASYR